MRTPVVVITGTDPEPMATLAVGLQWDLPRAVVVRHHIDAERGVLERVVSDRTGVVEREEIDLEHACVSCALREDVVPTLRRIASDGRWDSVLAHLPVGAEPDQLCAVVAGDTTLARHLRIHAVVVAADGPRVVEDLLGDALLRERGLHTSEDDDRGVGEVLSAMVEQADCVVAPDADGIGLALLAALARPGTPVLDDSGDLDAVRLVGEPRHDHTQVLEWTRPDRRGPLPDLPPAAHGLAWRVDLVSGRPFHPDRLLEDIEVLGAGRHRSRGCFWLPTRPELMGEWEGSGGQLGIGAPRRWHRSYPVTRVVLVGVGQAPGHVHAGFERLLVTEDELRSRGAAWEVAEDGLEPWLGPVRRVA